MSEPVFRVQVLRWQRLPLWTATVEGYAGSDFVPRPDFTRLTEAAAREAAHRWCRRRVARDARLKAGREVYAPTSDISDRIARSSLGTPEATAARESVDPERARRVVERADQLRRQRAR